MSETVTTSNNKTLNRHKFQLIRKRFPNNFNSQTTEEKLKILTELLIQSVEKEESVESELAKLKQQNKLASRLKDEAILESERIKKKKMTLESVCRNLNDKLKMMSEQQKLIVKEEDEKRNKLSESFQNSLETIKKQVDDSQENSLRLKEDNRELANRMQELIDEDNERNERIEQLTKKMKLEEELFKTMEKQLKNEYKIKLKETQDEFVQEKINFNQEKMKTTKLMTVNESLSVELESYRSKYHDFESTSKKATNIMQTYQKEMNTMMKKVRKMENDKYNALKLCKESKDIIAMHQTERSLLIEKYEKLQKKLIIMTSLSRKLNDQLKCGKELEISMVIEKVDEMFNEYKIDKEKAILKNETIKNDNSVEDEKKENYDDEKDENDDEEKNENEKNEKNENDNNEKNENDNGDIEKNESYDVTENLLDKTDDSANQNKTEKIDEKNLFNEESERIEKEIENMDNVETSIIDDHSIESNQSNSTSKLGEK
ncbi:hypothetical protein SNEBB_011021 [Seison nebaliae]|nr:hypothetical protein SNEBB_011021 [Seison nebaliae]